MVKFRLNFLLYHYVDFTIVGFTTENLYDLSVIHIIYIYIYIFITIYSGLTVDYGEYTWYSGVPP